MAAEKPSSLAPILRMEDVLELDNMLTPEGPSSRRLEACYAEDVGDEDQRRWCNQSETSRVVFNLAGTSYSVQERPASAGVEENRRRWKNCRDTSKDMLCSEIRHSSADEIRGIMKTGGSAAERDRKKWNPRRDTSRELLDGDGRGGSAEEIRGVRRRTDSSDEDVRAVIGTREVDSHSSGKRVQIVVDRYYRRRSYDGKMCKCYNRDMSGSSSTSHSARGYNRCHRPSVSSRIKSPDRISLHIRYIYLNYAE